MNKLLKILLIIVTALILLILGLRAYNSLTYYIAHQDCVEQEMTSWYDEESGGWVNGCPPGCKTDSWYESMGILKCCCPK